MDKWTRLLNIRSICAVHRRNAKKISSTCILKVRIPFEHFKTLKSIYIVKNLPPNAYCGNVCSLKNAISTLEMLFVVSNILPLDTDNETHMKSISLKISTSAQDNMYSHLYEIWKTVWKMR